MRFWYLLRVHIFFVQNLPINAHAHLLCRAKAQKFGSSLHLHPYCMYASSKCSSKSAHIRLKV